nr:sugar phosphate isomerase/epimerase family protein [uncultured Friedmanniella sp.]
MSIKLAAQEATLPGVNLQEQFQFALDCGFDGIELSGKGDGVFGARAGELREARADGVVMCSAVMHTPTFLGSFQPEARATAIRDLKVLLSTIVEAGGLGIVSPNAFGVFSKKLPPFTPPRSDEESRRLLVEALAELGEHAVREGSVLFLEPLNRYEDYLVNTLADAVSIVEEVGSPGVAVIADTYHMSIEEVDCAASIEAAGAHIQHVQLGDSNRLEPGAGHYDWPATLGALDRIGFDGWLAMECGLSGPTGDVLPGVAKLLRAR